MHQHVLHRDPVLTWPNHIQLPGRRVQAQPPVPLGAEQQRLAVLHEQLVLSGHGLVGEVRERGIVEHDAVLEDLDERCAGVGVGLLEHIHQVRLVDIHRTRHEPRSDPQGHGGRTDRIGHRAAWRGGRQRAPLGCRRDLALGQTVDLVVEQDDIEIDVAPQGMHQVISANTEPVAITRNHPDVEVGIRQLGARGHRWSPAVNRVKTVGGHVVGETRRAPDPRNEDAVLTRHLQVGQGLLNRLENGIVATPRAPADLLVRGKVLRLELGQYAVAHGVLPVSSRWTMAASMSAIRNGRPATRFSPSAGIR